MAAAIQGIPLGAPARPARPGTIVQVSSALAFRAIPLQSAYCAAKHASKGFTESLRTELLHDACAVRVTMVHMPALNTPQFDWVKSRLPNRAQPVPPIFQPEVGARAVVYAALHPERRDITVGASTARAIVGNRMAPQLLDRYLARKGYRSQQTDEPDRPDRPDNLWGAPGVFDVTDIGSPTNRVGGGAPLPNPQVFEIDGSANANRLSLAVMLICTNDGFTGLSGVKLPGGFQAEVHDVGAWDAGTEQNNERFDQIVDACTAAGPVTQPPDGNGRVATSGVILSHPNIQGIGDLSVSLHGWSFPVARITVQRIR